MNSIPIEDNHNNGTYKPVLVSDYKEEKGTWYPKDVRYCGEGQKAEQVCVDPKRK